jgi:hypothetical protein
MENCKGHDQLVREAAMGNAMVAEHGRQLTNISDMLIEVKTAVEQNQVRALARDEAIVAVNECIRKVDRKIENGLRSEVQDITRNLATLIECIEKRKAQRGAEVKRPKGIKAFIVPGWDRFKSEASFIFVTGSILLTVWFVFWSASKMAIFHEGPAGLLRMFGIGA